MGTNLAGKLGEAIIAEGYDAYNNQVEREDMPYVYGTKEAYEWGKGWDAAYQEEYMERLGR